MKDTLKQYGNDVTAAVAGGSIGAATLKSELLILLATLLAPIVKKWLEAGVDYTVAYIKEKLKSRKANV